MPIGQRWAGRIYGTNTGNLFVRLEGDDSKLSGQIHINDSVVGPIVYIISGKFGGGDLEVAGVPKEGGTDIGRFAAVLKLNQKGELEGRWETSKGYAGTLALLPHDKPEVSSVSEAIPDTLQLHTDRYEFGAIAIDRDEIVELAQDIQMEFTKSRVVVTVVAESEQARFLEDFKNTTFSVKQARIIRIFAREKESEESFIDKIISVEFGPKINIAMTQGTNESWVLGRIERIKRSVKKFERSYATNIRKTGVSINQLMLLAALVYMTDLPDLWSRATLVGGVIGIGLTVTWIHNRYLPFSAIYLASKPRGGLGTVLPTVTSWIIAMTAGVAAAVLAAYLQGWLGVTGTPSP